MRPYNIMDFRFQQIEEFLTIARSGSLTTASEILHISVSALSKNLKNLEDQLGLILFIRKKNRLILTPAGNELTADFTAAIAQIQRAVERAHSVQRAEKNHPLVVGISEMLNPDKHMIPGIRKYQKTNPDFTCFLEFYPIITLPQKVLSGEIDVAVAPLYEEDSYQRLREIEYRIVSRFALCADVALEHPLAKFDSIPFDMLKPYPFAIPSPSLKTGMEEKLILPLCKKYGFTPQICHYASTMRGLTYFQAQNSVVISDHQQLLAADKKRIVIENEQTGILMAWKKDTRPYDKELLDYVIEAWKTAE